MKKNILFAISICSILSFCTSCSTITVKTNDNFEIVELPDGSVVYLNHNTFIQYDKKFSDRTITQDGEAFYIVKPGGNPFIVSTPNGEITVTGTEFNVKSGDDDLEIEVEEGTVELKINDLIQKIKRGERAVYNKSRDVFEKGIAEFKSQVWTRDMEKEFKKLGKELKRSGKEIGKELKNIKKEFVKAVK